jgi:hypothetical protein
MNKVPCVNTIELSNHLDEQDKADRHAQAQHQVAYDLTHLVLAGGKFEYKNTSIGLADVIAEDQRGDLTDAIGIFITHCWEDMKEACVGELEGLICSVILSEFVQKTNDWWA